MMDDDELCRAGMEVSASLGSIGTRNGRIVRELVRRFQSAKVDQSDRMAGFVAEAEGLAHRLRLHAGLDCPAPDSEPEQGAS